ncbi:hypothetical protein MNV49_003008 [Pseudohyphozyma bogoriensis]|nr:hypothetical protein MNV49_003008 [Pseudohyphozyma bogoriensis]
MTRGRPWSFDLAAHSILVILEELGSEGVAVKGQKAVVVGDSMGGGPTGLRVALKDAEWAKKAGLEQRVLGVVACGTCAEEESIDFVEDYTADAQEFARQCEDPSIGVEKAIQTLANNMCQAGYTSSPSAPYASARAHGTSVIENSLRLALTNTVGVLEPKRAGEIMVQNYGILNGRKSLIPHLVARPSRLGQAQVLVVHGTEEAAYPFDRNYHERTASAIGSENATIHVVSGGPHFVTATHWEEVDKVIDEWVRKMIV